MAKYVTCLLFTHDGSEILTQMMTDGPNTGKFSGISRCGAKDEDPLVAAACAIAIETGMESYLSKLVEICSIDVPDDVIYGRSNERAHIHFYATTVDKSEVASQPGCAPLTWMPPKKLDSEPELFVDEGSLQYAVHLAIKKLKLTGRATRIRFNSLHG